MTLADLAVALTRWYIIFKLSQKEKIKADRKSSHSTLSAQGNNYYEKSNEIQTHFTRY